MENTSTRSLKVHFNVSGLKYETQIGTLMKFPDTLLGDPTRCSKYYDHDYQEYFFDRSRTAFDAILYYYQSGGKLIRPPSVPMDVFADELHFYELGEKEVRELLEEEGYYEDDDEEVAILPENELQRKIWQLFEYPDTSLAARIVAIISISVIVISILTFCLETLPMYRFHELCTTVPPYNFTANATNTTNAPQITIAATTRCKHVPSEDDKAMPWFGIEAACIAWFTLEYLMRLLSSPKKLVFVRSFLNMIDVVAIVPFYITLPLPASNISSLSVLRVLRLVRVFRIFKLSRHSSGLQILGHTLKASLRELGLLVFFLLIGVILFSSAVYFAEEGDLSIPGGTNQFLSIPHCFWWAIVTTTTVGYGDMYPVTVPGKLIGSLCAVCGVLTVALPVPVIVSNFQFFYAREHDIAAAKKSKKEREIRMQQLAEEEHYYDSSDSSDDEVEESSDRMDSSENLDSSDRSDSSVRSESYNDVILNTYKNVLRNDSEEIGDTDESVSEEESEGGRSDEGYNSTPVVLDIMEENATINDD